MAVLIVYLIFFRYKPEPAISKAAAAGDIAQMQRLIQNGAQVNEATLYG